MSDPILEACPWCGKPGEISETKDSRPDDRKYWPHCSNFDGCDLYPFTMRVFSSKEAAATAWNKRK